MSSNVFRNYRPGAIIPFIVLTGSVLNYVAPKIFGLFLETVPIDYIQFPSTAILLSGILWLIDKYLWHLKPFCWLYKYENISGRYKGYIEFNHYKSREKEKRDLVLEVEQTGSQIELYTYFNNGVINTSKSKSDKVHLFKGEIGKLQLFMNYYNNGNLVENIPGHFGTNVLEYSNGEFNGEYYTNKNPQTKGIMYAKFESKTLNRKF